MLVGGWVGINVGSKSLFLVKAFPISNVLLGAIFPSPKNSDQFNLALLGVGNRERRKFQ